jgi:hypothetical protein
MSDLHEDFLHRRHVLCGGGAFVFATMIASLLGNSKPVRAQAIVASVPQVDRVSVQSFRFMSAERSASAHANGLAHQFRVILARSTAEPWSRLT